MLDNNADRIGVLKCWFLRRGGNRSTRRKASRSRVENQRQTQATYDAWSRNRTRDTLVEDERSHHFASPSPQIVDLCFSKLRAAKSHNYLSIIVFEKLCFQNILRPLRRKAGDFKLLRFEEGFRKALFL